MKNKIYQICKQKFIISPNNDSINTRDLIYLVNITGYDIFSNFIKKEYHDKIISPIRSKKIFFSVNNNNDITIIRYFKYGLPVFYLMNKDGITEYWNFTITFTSYYGGYNEIGYSQLKTSDLLDPSKITENNEDYFKYFHKYFILENEIIKPKLKNQKKN